MKIEVLGPGCKRCEQLYDNVVAAASGMDPSEEIEVVKITDVNAFAKMGVFMTPGLVIDGVVISTGKLLSPQDIAAKIQERLPT
jgi:small redox-active disulfide protein 2